MRGRIRDSPRSFFLIILGMLFLLARLPMNHYREYNCSNCSSAHTWATGELKHVIRKRRADTVASERPPSPPTVIETSQRYQTCRQHFQTHHISMTPVEIKNERLTQFNSADAQESLHAEHCLVTGLLEVHNFNVTVLLH